ncbi:MAG: hypothetical protein HQL64_12900, partial [Magnetococcales bacterium]|nr:hypothetical protein [Magnetococcales bacterium]
QRLLAGRRTETGRVVALNGGMVRVATTQGVVEVVADAGLAVGDQVTVRDGRAIKSQGSTDAPVFFV